MINYLVYQFYFVCLQCNQKDKIMTRLEAKKWVRERVKSKVRNIISTEPFTDEAITKWGSKLVKREIYSYRKMYTITYSGSEEGWIPILSNGEPVNYKTN